MRYHTELTVKLDNLAYNYNLLKKITPNNEVIFMVKANAYGHGLMEIVSYAASELGVKRFGCASLGEAVAIRKTLPHLKCELWVFSDSNLEVDSFNELYLDYNIIPVIHNFADLERVLSNQDFKYMPLVVKIDTGMKRLGIKDDDGEKLVCLLSQYKRKCIDHLMTHLSSSYLKPKKGDRNQRQIDSFKKTLEFLSKNSIEVLETSVANSGAIEQGLALEFTHIRPGLMLYGPGSDAWKGKTVSSFISKIIKVDTVKRGTPVGYGGHVCGKDGYIIYLPVGYGDGIHTSYSGAKFSYKGVNAQILGRVNMDLTAIFFETLPSELKADSPFIFWDDTTNDINERAAQLKTITYQLFLGITKRVPRRYIK